MTPLTRPPSSDVGLRIVNGVYDQFKIDEQWTVWGQRGFTWWGWRCAQRVWSDRGVDDHGSTVYRLHAQTDFVDGFDGSEKQSALLNLLSLNASLSGVVRDLKINGRLRLATSVFAHEQNLAWASRLFAFATIMQVAEAEINAGMMAMGGLRQAASPHPSNGAREEMDDMLDIFKLLIRPEGEKPSAYVGKEFLELLKMLQQPPCVMANGDEGGLTAEYPFPGHTSLLRVTTEDQNPRAGNGLLARLTLPKGEMNLAGFKLAIELNEAELSTMTRCNFTGSWCVSKQGLTFVTFAPNALCVPSALTNIAISHVIRSRWVTENRFNFSQSSNFDQASNRKLSFFGRLFSKS
jgi:hypothetical protein